MTSRVAAAVGFVLAVVGLIALPHTVGADRGIRVGQAAPEITGGPVDQQRAAVARRAARAGGPRGVLDLRLIQLQERDPAVAGLAREVRAGGADHRGRPHPGVHLGEAHRQGRAATRELGVRYPVVQDNDFAIWRRYSQLGVAPAVIVDRKGVVRYHPHRRGRLRGDTEQPDPASSSRSRAGSAPAAASAS